MMQCRCCKHVLDQSKAVVISVPAGTQLFSDDVVTSLSLNAKIQILECSFCGLVQLAGDPVVYENVSSSSSFVSPKLTEHRLAQLQKLLNMRPELGSKGSVLEIGCGDGHLLEQSRSMFHNSVGIEPTKKNAEAAKSRDLLVHQMMMGEDVVVEEGPFDYFCSFHVLEHVTDICSVLQGIRRNLVENAVGVIEVPATEAAFTHCRFGDFMPDHLNYFTERTLRTALEWNGFQVEEIYRDWGGEHLVAFVRNRNASSLSYIVNRQKQLNKFVTMVNQSPLPFVIWGASHHVMPYMPILTGVKNIVVVDNSPTKIDRYIPATNIKVRTVAVLKEMQHIHIAVTAPRFYDEIHGELAKIFFQLRKMQIYPRTWDLMSLNVFADK